MMATPMGCTAPRATYSGQASRIWAGGCGCGRKARTMAIDTTINLLQTLHSSIQGVVSSPQLSAYPTVVDTAACPYVITWPTQGDWYMKGGGWKVQTRVYTVICFIAPT